MDGPLGINNIQYEDVTNFKIVNICENDHRKEISRIFTFSNFMNLSTDYGRPVRKLPSLYGQKSNPNPKFLGTAEAYFVCHIGPNFQIFLIYAFTGCP